jgi:cell division protease FtsH
MARAMVTRFGMSDVFGMMALETVNNPYLGTDSTLMVSPATAAKIDDEVLKIIQSCFDRATTILKDNKEKMNELTQCLLKKETMTGEEFMQVLNCAEECEKC